MKNKNTKLEIKSLNTKETTKQVGLTKLSDEQLVTIRGGGLDGYEVFPLVSIGDTIEIIEIPPSSTP